MIIMPRQKMKYPNLPEKFIPEAKRIRQELGISLRQFYYMSGVSPSQMSNFETGSRNPSYEKCVLIKKALNIDIDLPLPDISNRVIKRNRNKTVIETDSFLIEVDGRILKVLTYTDLGPVKNI